MEALSGADVPDGSDAEPWQCMEHKLSAFSGSIGVMWINGSLFSSGSVVTNPSKQSPSRNC